MLRLGTFLAGAGACAIALAGCWILVLGIPDELSVHCVVFFTERCRMIAYPSGTSAVGLPYHPLFFWISLLVGVVGAIIRAWYSAAGGVE
jgi:hypothetical protein